MANQPEPSRLTPQGDRLRKAWVAAVRGWYKFRSGVESNYKPNPTLDGGRNPRTGRKGRTPIWDKLATTVTEAGLDPVAATVCLLSWWDGPRPPAPDDILCQENVWRYRDRERRKPFEIENRLRADQLSFLLCLRETLVMTPDVATARRRVLTTWRNSLSPMTRYVVAVMYGYDDIARDVFPAAHEMYREAPPLYEELWKTVLTPDAVRALREGRHA